VKGTATLTNESEWIGPFGGGEEVTLGISAIHHSFTSVEDFRHEDVRPVVSHLTNRMAELAMDERYEEAAHIRNQLGAFLRGVSRGTRIRAFTQLPELIAAHPVSPSVWEIICVRYGRLVGSALSKSDIPIGKTIDSLRSTSEVLEDSHHILPHSTYEEVEKLLSFLEQDEVRLLSIIGDWTLPIFGAPSAQYSLEKMRSRNQESANFWLSSTQRANN
jgi:DNA polymerase-3 subunit epsilon